MADRKPQALPVTFQVAEDSKSATWQKNIVEYDDAQYLAGKKLTAYEWNALFVRIVKQGNHTADSLKAFIEGTLPTLLEAYDTTLRGLIAQLSALIGDLSELTTDQKSTIIRAINEVDAHADTAQQTADNATAAANAAQASADRANALLDDAILVRIESEPVTILTTDWVEDTTIDPFTVKAVKTSTLPLTGNRKRLVAPVFDTLDMARYGLVIGSIENNEITYYSTRKPLVTIEGINVMEG